MTGTWVLFTFRELKCMLYAFTTCFPGLKLVTAVFGNELSVKFLSMNKLGIARTNSYKIALFFLKSKNPTPWTSGVVRARHRQKKVLQLFFDGDKDAFTL